MFLFFSFTYFFICECSRTVLLISQRNVVIFIKSLFCNSNEFLLKLLKFMTKSKLLKSLIEINSISLSFVNKNLNNSSKHCKHF